jgi:Zn-dependent protease with chaperone function
MTGVASRKENRAASRWESPRTSIGGLLAAAASAASLALLGFTLLAQSPPLADRGHWSNTTLRHADPVAAPVAALALIVLAALVVRVAAASLRRLVAIRDAFRLAAALPTAGGELAVIHHPGRHAYAVPGRPGRIVVSSGLLRSLGASERRVVLVHERAHLTHHHHLHHATAHLAAAANPLLRRLPASVGLSTERWADECAAAACRRSTVADALIRAAHGGARIFTVPAAVLAATAIDVLIRVQALREPAPRLTLWRMAFLVALLLAAAAAVLEAAHDTERLFELAQSAYRSGNR